MYPHRKMNVVGLTATMPEPDDSVVLIQVPSSYVREGGEPRLWLLYFLPPGKSSAVHR